MNELLSGLTEPTSIAILAVLVIVPVFSKRKHRLETAVAVSIPWLTLGFFVDWTVSGPAKLLSFVPLILIAWAAWTDSNKKATLPPIAYALPATAAFSVVFVATTTDAAFAVAIQTMWLLLTITACLVGQTITGPTKLRGLLLSVVIGTGVVVVFTSVGTLVGGPESLRSGRITLGGVNPNHLGVIMLFAVPITYYLALTDPRRRHRTGLALLGTLALAVAFACGSRAILVGIAIGCLPMLWLAGRQSRLLSRLALMLLLLGGMLIAIEGISVFSRFSSVESGRFAIASSYLDVVGDRLWTGLLFRSELASAPATQLGWTPHNSFLAWLYLGGLFLTIPLVVVGTATVIRSARLAQSETKYSTNWLLYVTLGFSMAGTYVVALTNGMLFYPTNSWAVVHAILATSLIGLAPRNRLSRLRIRRVHRPSLVPTPAPHPPTPRERQRQDRHWHRPTTDPSSESRTRS